MTRIYNGNTAEILKSMISGALYVEIKNFRHREFMCPCCGAMHMSDTHIMNLQVYRNFLERKHKRVIRIVIVSGCRCVKHNRAVGGVKKSRHLFIKRDSDGTDIKSPDLSKNELYEAAKELRVFSTVIFKIKKNSLHLDSRPDRLQKCWIVE